MGKNQHFNKQQEKKAVAMQPVEEQAPVEQVEVPVSLENVEAFKQVMAKVRDELVILVNEGHLAPAVADQIMQQKQLEGFNKLVGIKIG